MNKPVVVSGIQPTGALHIGNYLGALKNFVQMQESGTYDCYFFIADLHSLTESYEASQKKKQILDLAATFLAAGLNPKKSTLFIQSDISAHTELSWILTTLTPMGELERMTQFKDKSETGNINAGLFTYPVLMASDILLYNARFVPVGEDQLQHLELARTLARKFNHRFGEILTEPKALMTSVPRLMSLDDPTKKMSKSRPAGCLFIDDEPEVIKKKIMSAVTDSGAEIRFDEKHKAGISNLLLIVQALTSIPIPKLEEKFAQMQYSKFKAAVSDIVADYFAPYRKKKAALTNDIAKVTSEFKKGSAAARKIAEKKIIQIKEKIGLL